MALRSSDDDAATDGERDERHESAETASCTDLDSSVSLVLMVVAHDHLPSFRERCTALAVSLPRYPSTPASPHE